MGVRDLSSILHSLCNFRQAQSLGLSFLICYMKGWTLGCGHDVVFSLLHIYTIGLLDFLPSTSSLL